MSERQEVDIVVQYWIHGKPAYQSGLGVKASIERITIDRESGANHDLIQWLDEPSLQAASLNIRKYLFPPHASEGRIDTRSKQRHPIHGSTHQPILKFTSTSNELPVEKLLSSQMRSSTESADIATA